MDRLAVILHVAFCLTVLVASTCSSRSWKFLYRQKRQDGCQSLSATRECCLLPEQPEFGSYTTPECEYGGTRCTQVPGTPVPQNWLLSFKCNDGYYISGTSEDRVLLFCNKGNWSQTIPVCKRMCSPLISSSVEVKCWNQGNINCSKSMRPGTRATGHCKPSYELIQPPPYYEIFCRENGQWTNELFHCEKEAPTQNGGETGTTSTGVTLPNTDVCGKRGGRFKRVIGGSDADPGMFPWVAALGYRSSRQPNISWRCVGSLVTDRHLVTGATCANGSPDLVLSVVRLGVLDINDIGKGQTTTDYEVDSWIPHPGYSATKKVNDIAIVKLKNKVTFSRLIQPICLPTLDEFRTKNFTGSAAYIAGWGATSYRGPLSTRLQQAQVRVWGQQECKAAYDGKFKSVIDNRVLCAADDGIDACQGDTGGPLMMPYGPSSNYYLLGLVSYGYRCAEPGYPGVYTRVTEVIDWILLNLK